MYEPITQLPQDDWVDQDLLTRDLAGSLLDDEIKSDQSLIDQYDRGGPVPGALLSREDTKRRLDAMVAIREGLRQKNRL